MMKIEIIVSKYFDGRAIGVSLRDESFYGGDDATAVAAAKIAAAPFKMPGFSVVVRPKYKIDGRVVEWRSFNGEHFNEVCFSGAKVA